MARFRSRPKIHIRRDLDAVAFFARLNEAGARHVLLRWWENFPKHARGEDFDVLIHRDDYRLVEPLLTAARTDLRCDVYFHRGTGGNRKSKIPYLSPKLAADTLDNRVLHAGSVYVPSPRHYFASLAFHALFHKGADSGLPGFETHDMVRAAPEHDYRSELSRAAKAANIGDVPINAPSLFDWLRAEGYAPPLDMLGKLADKHPELIVLAGLPEKSRWQLEGELMLFVVRDVAGSSRTFIPRFVSMLEDELIEVIEVHRLAHDEATGASELRGGNWGRGPYAISAGPPHTFIVGYDWSPKPFKEHSGHALLLNANLTKLKNEARRLYNMRRLPWNRGNPVHTPDNELEVYEYLAKANPALAERMRRESQMRKQRYGSTYPVIEVLSARRRSRTELMRYASGKAIQKTFKLGFESCCQREIDARRFAGKVPMPQILESAEGRVVMEYLPDRKHLNLESLSAEEKHNASKRFVEWVRAFWEQGYFHGDFSPRNILVAPNGDMALIDYEFLQAYQGARPEFSRAFEFEGVPVGVTSYDLPATRARRSLRHPMWRLLPFKTYIAPLIDKG